MEAHGMKICMIAPEMAPLVKTGGLADVLGALPQALAARGHDVVAILPYYGKISREPGFAELAVPQIIVDLPVGKRELAAWTLRLGDVTVYLIEDDPLFARPELYAEKGREYPDNALRYAYFCGAALWLMKGIGWIPDIVHAHDWQSALVPIFLRTPGPFARDAALEKIRILFTIHNLAYQGLYPSFTASMIGLAPEAMKQNGLEYWGSMNLLKGGLVYSDWLTAVSPTYAREIQSAELGFGLEGVIGDRAGRLTGILNGIDAEEWNPETDPLIAAHYSGENLEGKGACKAALQRRLGLTIAPRTPLMGVVSRLVDQKGFDLIAKVLPEILAGDAQIAILGTGQPEYHELLTALAQAHPGKLGLVLGFDNALAHRIEAGADLFLMPSQFEPCGLNQMYSLRYGTIPVVRKTGGLADTIADATPDALAWRTATGFVFEEYSAAALAEAIGRGLKLFRDDPTGWTVLMRTAMAKDHSWDRSAAEYEALMGKMLAAG
jgi:starch synthase